MRDFKMHLNALFVWMQPERVLNLLRKHAELALTGAFVHFESPDEKIISAKGYVRTVQPHMQHLSANEIEQRYWDLQDFLQANKERSFFSLLPHAVKPMLRIRNQEPLCRQEYLMDWRELTHNLGQDIFTSGLLAHQDDRDHCHSTFFSWPAVIRSDNYVLWKMLEAGLAENHFHLNGSTQVFPLAWGFLMNYPEKAQGYFKAPHFQNNLKNGVLQGILDNQLPWWERIYYAAWIRGTLFSALLQTEPDKYATPFFDFDSTIDKARHLQYQMANLRFFHGTHFQQISGRKRCLDYAITMRVEEENKGPFRFLAGERTFLYQAFRACFSKKFSELQQTLFYLYLLLKKEFRNELVQSNGRTGFQNFFEYQDRKTMGWGMQEEYWAESRRLAINGTLASSVQSLEMRIMPSNTCVQLKRGIREDDRYVAFAEKEILEDTFSAQSLPNRFKQSREIHQEIESSLKDYFYVIHFLKMPLRRTVSKDLWRPLQARNHDMRLLARRQAKVLAKALQANSDLCHRIRGIDAASHEIGCRPETFATEFRFLRGFCPSTSLPPWKTRCWPLLGASYHAGEDFLDIADGLRSIDEASCFLNLERGDRIGHALALGVNPESHYAQKGGVIYLPKQDLLDNLVWMLLRCSHWGIQISAELRSHLKERAQLLMRDLYDEYARDANLMDYFNSWMLRGDHPDIYRSTMGNLLEVKEQLRWMSHAASTYTPFQINGRGIGNFEMEDVRRNPKALILLWAYHFDARARIAGQDVIRWDVTRDYILLMRQMQDFMMARMMRRGLCIECNPSSNFLIGSFRDYSKHPIFRFNHFGLVLPEWQAEGMQVQVSLNTDDQGVFDTSLENEYALTMAALQSRLQEDGQRLLSDDTIKAYLNHVREMGIEMVFPSASQNVLHRKNWGGY